MTDQHAKADFFVADKTYSLERSDDGRPARIVFQCFGAGVIPVGAIGAGGRIAAGYQGFPAESESLNLVLMTEEAWADGWVEVEQDGTDV